jgi:hypothetical protein
MQRTKEVSSAANHFGEQTQERNATALRVDICHASRVAKTIAKTIGVGVNFFRRLYSCLDSAKSSPIRDRLTARAA